MEDSKRFYWLKLKRDFFKRHDIRIIENMKNGKDYILFYLKLLCESIDHDGDLRFSEKIPYSEEMLATITDTNVDIVRAAVNMFIQLGMMEMMDDGTYFMCEVQKMIGSASNTDGANRIRRFRERQKENLLLEGQNVTKCNGAVTESITEDNESKSIELDKEKEKEIETDKEYKRKRFTRPTFEEVEQYCYERKYKVNAQRFLDYYDSNGWKVGRNPMKDWKAAVRNWEREDGKPKQAEKAKKPMDERTVSDDDFGYDFSELMSRQRSGE